MEFKNTIINLKILANLTTGSKINSRNVKNKQIEIENPSIYQGLLRLYRRNDRHETLEFIGSLVKDLSEILNETAIPKYGFQSSDEFFSYIQPIIKSAIDGISTLLITYEEDLTFKSVLSVEIENLIRICDSIKFKTS